MPTERKLAAIMFTDIVGYTALMSQDEQKALELLKTNRELLKPIIKEFRGEWLKEMGDGSLSSFSSAIDAVGCALAMVGEKESAIEAGFKAMALMPISECHWWGPSAVMVMAYIYTIVGEYDKALDKFELLLSIPCNVSTAWLKADPILEPLQELPRFNTLIKRYEVSS